MEEEGPVIKYDDNGRKVFVFNPYYHGKDPMKEIIWKVRDENGLWGFVKNPFAPNGDDDLGTTQYEKIQRKGFIQPEVDPYFK